MSDDLGYLLELSHLRSDNLVTPLILCYFSLERLGYDRQQILNYLTDSLMENKYNLHVDRLPYYTPRNQLADKVEQFMRHNGTA